VKVPFFLFILLLLVSCRDESTNPTNEIPSDAQVQLISPPDSTFINNSNSILIRWNNFYNSTNYQLQLATDILCNNILYSTETSDTIIATPNLDDDWYFWRVRAEISNGDWNDWSSIWSFEINLPPSPPKIVPKTSDTLHIEMGIDAIYDPASPFKNHIYLEWYRNSESELKGYKIFRNENEYGVYSEIGSVTSIGRLGVDTSFIDKTCSLNQGYFYFVKAFDELNQVSEPSDTAYYKLSEVPILIYPIYNIGNVISPTFKWSFGNSIFPHYFVFRLGKSNNELYQNIHTKLCERITNYQTAQEWDLQSLGFTSTLISGTYRWRIDSVGHILSWGAESAWLIFVIE
jgi:hypothetical protein